MTDDVEDLYAKILEFTDDLLFEHEPLAVAAILNTISLSMWKTMLSEDDYSSMIQAIVDNSDQVKTFKVNDGYMQ